jgi:DNA-binding protein Fis
VLGRDRKKKKEEQEALLAEAEQTLEQSRAERRKQERLREQEREALEQRLDRLAGNDSNHLGRLVLRALTEKYGRGPT